MEVFPGVEGLVHISQISQAYCNASRSPSRRDQVQVKVLEVNPEEHRIAFKYQSVRTKT